MAYVSGCLPLVSSTNNPCAAPPGARLIASFPIDDVAQRFAVEISAQIFAEEVDGAMPVFVTGARDMRRDQHPRIGPQLRRRRMFEFADIDIEHDAAQMIALKRVGQGLLVNDLAACDVDEHAPRLHYGKAVFVEETRRLRGPLTADHDKIAGGQIAVELRRCAEFTEPVRQRGARIGVPAGADDSHPEGSTKPTGLEPDAAGAHDACSLALQQQRPIAARVKRTRLAVANCAVQALGEVQNPSYSVLRHREGTADAARGCDRDVAAPQITPEEIAGARWTLVKPFQSRRSGPQVERKWPAAENDLRFGKQAIAFLARSRPRGIRPQIPSCRVCGPGFAVLAVEPTDFVRQYYCWVDGLNPGK